MHEVVGLFGVCLVVNAFFYLCLHMLISKKYNTVCCFYSNGQNTIKYGFASICQDTVLDQNIFKSLLVLRNAIKQYIRNQYGYQ